MNANAVVPLRVVVVGLGTIGRAVARVVLNDPSLTLAGGTDISSAALDHAREEIGGDTTWADLAEIGGADVAIVTAGPRFDRIAPTLRQLMHARTSVVSDCAQMTWPWLRHPHLADVIAGEARKAGVALVGTGADPIAAMLTGVGKELFASDGASKIVIRRGYDLATARPSIVRQVGVGRTPEQFRRLAAERIVGLPGQGEWVVLIAQAMGRHPRQAEVMTSVRPLTGDGRVNGLHQRSAWSDDTVAIEIDETATAGGTTESTVEFSYADAASKSYVEPLLPASDVEWIAKGLVDVARHIKAAPPGLLTPLDVMAFAARSED